MPHPTSITQIPVANDRIQKDVSLLTKTEQKVVLSIAKFIGRYIAATMERGQMEAVMLPYFGKFKPKKTLMIEKAVIARERSGMDIVYRAVKGRKVVDLRDKTNMDKAKSAKIKNL